QHPYGTPWRACRGPSWAHRRRLDADDSWQSPCPPFATPKAATARPCIHINMSRSPASLSLAFAARDFRGQSIELGLPELTEWVEPPVHFRQRCAIDAVDAPRAFRPHHRKAALAQHRSEEHTSELQS